MTVCTPTSAARRAFRPLAGLTPLLLSLAVCNAHAIDVTIVGRNGADGAQGVVGQMANGGDGQSAPLAQYLFGSQDARNTLSLFGGNGGAGGDGADAGKVLQPECNQFGSCYEVPVYYYAGYGGGGSNGAQTIGSVTTRSGATSGVAESRVTGGTGGSSSRKSTNWSLQDFANIGNGGDATSVASVFVTGAASADVRAYATGGNGAFSAESPADSSSNGGRALARAYGQSGTGAVNVLAAATGGVAGIAKRGAGGASLIDAVSGATSGTLTLTQHVQGAASDQLYEFPRGDSDASSSLTLSDARASRLSATVEAIGGDGSRQFIGGNATATLTLSSTRAGARYTDRAGRGDRQRHRHRRQRARPGRRCRAGQPDAVGIRHGQLQCDCARWIHHRVQLRPTLRTRHRQCHADDGGRRCARAGHRLRFGRCQQHGQGRHQLRAGGRRGV